MDFLETLYAVRIIAWCKNDQDMEKRAISDIKQVLRLFKAKRKL